MIAKKCAPLQICNEVIGAEKYAPFNHTRIGADAASILAFTSL
jgi:hypothetical protein